MPSQNISINVTNVIIVPQVLTAAEEPQLNRLLSETRRLIECLLEFCRKTNLGSCLVLNSNK